MTASKSSSSAVRISNPPRSLWLAALVGFVLAALLSLALGAREQNIVFDGWQRMAPRDLSESQVRIVAIGDESLEVIGSWPWPRRVLATMTQRIAEGGAAAIGFDILFVEPDAVSPTRFSRLYAPDDPAIRAWLDQLDSMDADFADAISTAPVVLGRAGVKLGGADPAGLTQWATISGSTPPALLRYPLVQSNLEALEARAPGFGLLNGAPDGDGVVRSVPLVMKTGEALAPGLALEMMRVAIEQLHGEAERGHVARRKPRHAVDALGARLGDEGASRRAHEVGIEPTLAGGHHLGVLGHGGGDARSGSAARLGPEVGLGEAGER